MMSTRVKLGAFALGLVAVFGVALGVGAKAGPIAGTSASSHNAMSEHGSPMGEDTVQGLAVAQAGYRLVPTGLTLPVGPAVPFSFRVLDTEGMTLNSYEPSHDKDLHLIVVRRDLSGFQHVHPTRTGDGRWAVALDLSSAGAYRVFADFVPQGSAKSITLGTDVFVSGPFSPRSLPAPAATTVVDGYTVKLTGNPTPGADSDLVFTVSHSGVDAILEPYLGAYGHLVSLRQGDLAYLHTHPAQDAAIGRTAGPDIAFSADFPTAGVYRLFLNFQVEGKVLTAEFTVHVETKQP